MYVSLIVTFKETYYVNVRYRKYKGEMIIGLPIDKIMPTLMEYINRWPQ